MATTPTTQADRIARSLKRLGFRLTRIGRSFTIIDSTGRPATGSKTGMSLGEVERSIRNRPGTSSAHALARA